jgi:hypothetical protein
MLDERMVVNHPTRVGRRSAAFDAEDRALDGNASHDSAEKMLTSAPPPLAASAVGDGHPGGVRTTLEAPGRTS